MTKSRITGCAPVDEVALLAADVLVRSEKEGAQLYSQLHASLDRCRLDSAEKAKVTALVTGVCEHLISIDYILNLFSKTKTDQMKPQIRAILRLGVCQLVFMERTSAAAAVSSCVELARKRGFAALTGYVNGVLRTIGREKDKITYPDISTRYSMPNWICERLKKRFGQHKNETGKENKSKSREENITTVAYGAEQILQYFERENTVTIRLDERLSKQESDMLIKRIAASSEKINLMRHPFLFGAYILEQAGDIRKLPGFADGAFYVQDAGAQLAVELAGIKEGDTVIDVCAAPGGKSVHAYAKCCGNYVKKERLHETTGQHDGRHDGKQSVTDQGGRVIAMDLTERKCDLIRENAKRLHADNMEVYAHDARKPDERFLGLADVVICDLPCSGLGIMGRKADIRYRLREEDITELAALQKEILRASVRYLKKGGTLLYATCTLTPEENEENAAFICQELGLKPVDLTKQVQDILSKACDSTQSDLQMQTQMPGQTQPQAQLQTQTQMQEQLQMQMQMQTQSQETADAAKNNRIKKAEFINLNVDLLSVETLRDGYLTLPPGKFLTDGFFIFKSLNH